MKTEKAIKAKLKSEEKRRKVVQKLFDRYDNSLQSSLQMDELESLDHIIMTLQWVLSADDQNE